VLEALDGLNLDVTTGKTASSVVAVLEGPRPGPTTLLRGDMDALPMPEETGLPYASTVAGAMHACGHDAHTAMLAGAAKLLGAHREHLAGRVVFMFQPGEEGAGGAQAMLDEGLLERRGPIDRAFALHVIPLIPSGMVAGRPGPTMATGLLGKGRVLRMPTPVMASEDWSFVLQKVPGCILALGVAPPGVQQPASIHSSRMVLDEAAMTTGIALHAALASSPQQHSD
jgi:metal-dependent amidase/aminoacylase/carboxypeptidase family protein